MPVGSPSSSRRRPVLFSVVALILLPILQVALQHGPAHAQQALFASNQQQYSIGLPSARMSDRVLRYAGCVDIRGREVAAVVDSQIPDVARAFVDQQSGQPLVAYNPAIMGMLAPETQLFFFVHECAHHVIGHAVGLATPRTMEQEADCWAANRLHMTGLLGPRELQIIQADIIRYGRGDATHLPGNFRAANLAGCVNGSEPVTRLAQGSTFGIPSGGATGAAGFVARPY